MIYAIRILSGFLVLFFAYGTQWRSAAVPATRSLSSALDVHMTALTKMGQFNGVILVEKDEETVLFKAYNTEKLESENLRVSTRSQFDLRSVSKLLAKTVLYEWEREGKLDLSAPLSEYMDGFAYGDRVTIEQLMNHTSGLPRECSNLPGAPIELSPEEVIELLKKETLEYEPGSGSRYSNPGYQILYGLIGAIAGKPYPQVLRERYFDPLQMTGTGAHFFDPSGKLSHYAYGHYMKNNRLQALENLDPDDMQQGHLYSTARDMGAFLRYLQRSEVGRQLSEEGIITHAGGSRGKRAWVYANMDKHYRVVFLSNTDMLPFEQLTKDLVRIIEGEKVAVPQPVNRVAVHVGAEVLRQYEGVYDFAEAGHLVLEFRLEEDSLVAWQKGQKAGVLIPESDSVFFWDKESAESVVFKKEASGTIKAYLDFQGVRWEGQKIKDSRGKSQDKR